MQKPVDHVTLMQAPTFFLLSAINRGKICNIVIVKLQAFPDFLLQPFRKPKRVRTAFSPTQLLKLEHAFEGNHYVVGAERKTLAQQLGLTETQVRICGKSFTLLYSYVLHHENRINLKMPELCN